MPDRNFSRLSRRTALGLLLVGVPVASGCVGPWFRAKTPEEASQLRREEIREALSSETRPRLISEIGVARGLSISVIENVGLVTRLRGTGGKVKPSQPRKRMLTMMSQNNTKNRNALLDDKTTAMVLATSHIPPGSRKGTVLDVMIQLSSHAEATRLDNGWLMPAPLVQMSKLGGQIREGFKAATATGPIVTLAQANGSEEPLDKLRGSIIGGSKFSNQRELGISIDENYADAITMKKIVDAIGERFTYFDGRNHTCVATPTSSNRLEIQIPTRYELDPYHYINVVLNLGFTESQSERAARMQIVAQQMLDPATSQRACWQLEAIGESAIETLASGLTSPNPLVQFYASHSLAYLEDERSITPLKNLCDIEPAFRAMAFNALSTLDSFKAETALRELLHSADPETRYGAVRALRRRDQRDPQVKAAQIGKTGQLLEIPSEGPPLVVVSLTQVPEVVVFGATPIMQELEFVDVNPQLMIRSDGTGLYSVSHFVPGREDRIVQSAGDLRSLLTAISDVGGSYGDWVSFIRQASEQSHLREPIAINPVATAGRKYHQAEASGLEPGETKMAGTIVNTISSDAFDEDDAPKRNLLNPFTWWSN